MIYYSFVTKIISAVHALTTYSVFQVSQYKKSKERKFSQGRRRYDAKQSGFGGQTKPIFRKKVNGHFATFLSFMIKF